MNVELIVVGKTDSAQVNALVEEHALGTTPVSA